MDEMIPAETIENGKSMALVAWIGLLVGLPLFIIPFVQNDNDFATYHARHALVAFVIALLWSTVLIVAFLMFAIVTCGFGYVLFPIVFLLLLLPLIPVVDGLIKAANGKVEPPLAIGELTGRLFKSGE